MKTLTLEQCMDILDWFDDPMYDTIAHELSSKVDGKERVERTMPLIIEHCTELMDEARGTEAEYPYAE